MSFFSLFIAWRYIKGRERNLLSINARLSFIGVFVGTSLLVVVLSIFNGFQAQVKKSIFQFDPHLIIENPSGAGKINHWKNWMKKIEDRIGHQAESIKGMIQSPGILRRRTLIDHVLIRGQSFEQNEKGDYILPKSFPKIVQPKDFPELPKGATCLIGKEMAFNMNIAIGDFIELIVPRGQFSLRVGVRPNMKAFKVAGFFKTGHYQYDSKAVIISLDSAQKLFAIGKEMQQIVVRLKDLAELENVQSELYRLFPLSFHVRTIEDEQRNFFAALKLEKVIMTIIVSLFILAAMVGIVVATYNVIRSRKKDIGILKAIGVSNTHILSIFTVNGFLMGAIGACVGILFGVFLSLSLESIINSIESSINFFGNIYIDFMGTGFWKKVQLIPKDVYYFDTLPIEFDLEFLHIIGVLSILLSGIAAFIPALYASRLEPIDIIRSAE